MSPFDHYREAERLLCDAAGAEPGTHLERYCLAAAQVHATLANAHMTAGVWGAMQEPEDRSPYTGGGTDNLCEPCRLSDDAPAADDPQASDAARDQTP